MAGLSPGVPPSFNFHAVLTCSTFMQSLVWRDLTRIDETQGGHQQEITPEGPSSKQLEYLLLWMSQCVPKLAVMLAAFHCVEKLGRRQLCSVWAVWMGRGAQAMDAWEKGEGWGRVCSLWRCATKVTCYWGRASDWDHFHGLWNRVAQGKVTQPDLKVRMVGNRLELSTEHPPTQ
jgi:hypothetical protein